MYPGFFPKLGRTDGLAPHTRQNMLYGPDGLESPITFDDEMIVTDPGSNRLALVPAVNSNSSLKGGRDRNRFHGREDQRMFGDRRRRQEISRCKLSGTKERVFAYDST